MNNIDIFRPRSSVVAAWVAYIGIGIMVVQSLFTTGVLGIIIATSWGICIATTVYIILDRPKIELFDEGIRITNPLKQISVGWDKVESIDTKYTMSIRVAGKTIYAWAAPAPGPHQSRKIHPSDIYGMNIGADGYMRPGDNPRTHSGTAAYLATLRLKSFRDSAPSINYFYTTLVNYKPLIIIGITASIGIILNVVHL